MKKFVLALLASSSILLAEAQFTLENRDESWKTVYRETPQKINNLVHTKLDVTLDFDKSYLYGKAWITLKPHFYPTDSLLLDAKGMDIHKVAIIQKSTTKPLQYTYDKLQLNIRLDKTYKHTETYTIYIDYTAKPDELAAKGSEAITDAKGLYFINPRGEDKNKPTQVWTQGETEASSVWFPTIDKPNQKTTQEIAMTVPAKFVTLSNGKMVAQKANSNGTRTDTWKMEQPHAPYLFFMGVGDYAIVKDNYKGKEVSYYVEKEYEKVARRIFGETPAMMAYFSKILGVEYPWVKYGQIVGRDYVSGAMENTTATIHRSDLQQNARELSDGNKYEPYIPHELFHQWFGNLVTAESWSNLPVNESFANYSETLWDEYKYGKDAAQARNYNDMHDYLASRSANKDLIRFYYNDKEDMFDLVSYNKGGRILHMLRNYVGDSAFFKALNFYLVNNRFKAAEAAHVRLAFEEVTGKDLNWYWNQWFYGSGHPVLDIKYGYNDSLKKTFVYITQTQQDKLFRLPIDIDVYHGSNKTRQRVWINNRTDTFAFAVAGKPSLVNVDAEKQLLAEKTDHKTAEEFSHQYAHANNYVDRREAIDYAFANIKNEAAKAILVKALDDKNETLRARALQFLSLKMKDLGEPVTRKIINMAQNDKNRPVKAAAIDALAALNRQELKPLFIKATTDSSYTVAGAALEALVTLDNKEALSLVPELQKDAKGRLAEALKTVAVLQKSDADFEAMSLDFDKLSLFDKFYGYRNYLLYLRNVHNTGNLKKGVDRIIQFRDLVAGYSEDMKQLINQQLLSVKEYKNSLGTEVLPAEAKQEQAEYIDQKVQN